MKSRVGQAAAYVAHGVCEPYDADKSPEAHGRLTDTAAVLHLLTGVLSSGVAALPFAFRSSGCALGLVLLAGCTLASVASAQLLFEAAHLTGAHSYTSLAATTLGRRAGMFTGACIAAVQFGGVVACINVLADLLSAWAGQDLPAGAEPSRVPVFVALLSLALLSLVLGLRSQRGVHVLTLTGTAFVLAFPLALLTHALSRPADVAAGTLDLWRPKGAAVALSVISYGLGNSHGSMLFSISASLRPERQAPVVALSLVAAAVVYGVVGLGGYATFREATQGEVLRTFGRGGGSGGGARLARVTAQALRLGYGLSVSSAVPLALMPLRDALTPWVARHCTHSAPGEVGRQLMQSAITAGLLLLVLCSALLLPNLEFVAALVGATCCILLSSVLPAAISLRVAASHPGRGARRASSTAARSALLVAGLLACGLCTRATLSAVVQEQEAVALAQVMVAAEKTVEVKTQRLTAAVAAVNTLSAVEDAAAQLSQAQGEADVALGRAQSATAQATAASRGGRGRATRPDPAAASAGELEDAAAALASARSKVEFKLASVVGAVEALDDITRSGAASSLNSTRPPASKGASGRTSGLLSPPATQNRSSALQMATNNTVAAVQHTAAALAVAQQALNSAAGALAAQAHGGGGAGRGTGISAAGVDVAAAAAGAASRSSNDTLASLHAMAATQAVELEAELVDALQEVQAEVGQAGAGAVVGGSILVSGGAAAGNTTTAAQAAVQAVARTTVAGASAVVRIAACVVDVQK